MEPLAILLAALAAGSNGLIDATAQDLYGKLKELILNRLQNKPEAKLLLDKYSSKPDIWVEPLKAELTAAGTEQDSEILQVAKQLVDIVKPQQNAVSKFSVQAEQVEGVVQGDYMRVQMNFGSKKGE